MTVYADINSTLPLDKKVRDYLLKRLNEGPYANPNSLHQLGKIVKNVLEKSRRSISINVDAKSGQVIFTSGASESITMAFKSAMEISNKKIILISKIEHSACINAAEFYNNKSHKIVWVKTLSSGKISLEDLEEKISKYKDDVALVVAQAANNETGVIQPYEKIGELCKINNLNYFCDATQIVGKENFSFKKSNATYSCFSGHKIGALTGVGVFLVESKDKAIPLIFGGGQEFSLRGGTQNYIGIETLAVSMQELVEKIEYCKELKNNQLIFEKKLKEKFPELVIFAEDSRRLPGCTMLAYPGVHGQSIQITLEEYDVFVSTSSACSDNDPRTSHVLQAMGINDTLGRGAVRISISHEDSKEKYEKIFYALVKSIDRLKEGNSSLKL